MNEVIMLRETEPVKILHKILEKRIPIFMSFLSGEKWSLARLMVTSVQPNSFKAKLTPHKKTHPITISPNQQVGISLRYEYGCGRFIFDTTVLTTDSSTADDQILTLAIPEQVEIIQRRSYFRVKVPASLNVEVTLSHRDTAQHEQQYHRCKARLIDLSAGGLQVALDVKDKSRFQNNQFLALRFAPFPNETPIAFNAQIRNIFPTANDQSICLGLQMVGLEASPEGRFVLQRLCNIAQQYQQMNATNHSNPQTLNDLVTPGDIDLFD